MSATSAMEEKEPIATTGKTHAVLVVYLGFQGTPIHATQRARARAVAWVAVPLARLSVLPLPPTFPAMLYPSHLWVCAIVTQAL
jgi:hypothetical protein